MTRRRHCTAIPLHSRRVSSVRESMQQTGGCPFLPRHEPRGSEGYAPPQQAQVSRPCTYRLDLRVRKDNARYTLGELVRDGTSKALRTHAAIPRGQTWNGSPPHTTNGIYRRCHARYSCSSSLRLLAATCVAIRGRCSSGLATHARHASIYRKETGTASRYANVLAAVTADIEPTHFQQVEQSTLSFRGPRLRDGRITCKRRGLVVVWIDPTLVRDARYFDESAVHAVGGAEAAYDCDPRVSQSGGGAPCLPRTKDMRAHAQLSDRAAWCAPRARARVYARTYSKSQHHTNID
jgi:hypothetical protein